jgi:AcrR family transcriptional regulator
MANTASAPARRRRDRGSISVDEILNGAFEVAGDVSIDNLSMPLLAKHLDVGVTSIYWYFRRKDELLDAMSDRALERFEVTAPSIDASNWRESLRSDAQNRYIGFADEIDFDYILDSILDHAETLIAAA